MLFLSGTPIERRKIKVGEKFLALKDFEKIIRKGIAKTVGEFFRYEKYSLMNCCVKA